MNVRFCLFAVLSLIFSISSSLIIAQDKFEVTVSQDGTGDYTNIQSAIDACKAFPDQRIIIHIRNGIYYEKVVVPVWNNRISLIGENAEKTITSPRPPRLLCALRG